MSPSALRGPPRNPRPLRRAGPPQEPSPRPHQGRAAAVTQHSPTTAQRGSPRAGAGREAPSIPSWKGTEAAEPPPAPSPRSRCRRPARPPRSPSWLPAPGHFRLFPPATSAPPRHARGEGEGAGPRGWWAGPRGWGRGLGWGGAADGGRWRGRHDGGAIIGEALGWPLDVWPLGVWPCQAIKCCKGRVLPVSPLYGHSWVPPALVP